ncbi:MAG TPA: organomercurial lyase MerB [Pseudonocardia sp.]|nr:organomercurial lyase MerB [Pseudonocardia sp.]
MTLYRGTGRTLGGQRFRRGVKGVLVMDDLRASLVSVLGHGDFPLLMGAIVRLVAQGEPVALDRLADEAGLPLDRVESWLHGQPGTDWAEDGRLLGFGLTQRRTPHRFRVGNRVLYAFCAADTLFFPPMLGEKASVESTCPSTGQRIGVELTPEAVTSVDPATAVVSQASLHFDMTDIRANSCDHGHFFASLDAAAEWRRDHPDGAVRPIGEYFTVGLAASRELGWAAA